MKKYLLLLAAGAVALPGLAMADAHDADESSWSISGGIRVQHTQSTDNGVTTANTSTHSDDTYIRLERGFTNSNAGDATTYLHFQPSGEWRYGVTATSTKDSWTVSGKGEWDAQMSGDNGAASRLRDSFVKATNDSGAYFQVGKTQYGDQLRGYSNGHGGNIVTPESSNFRKVMSGGYYNGNGYLASDESKFTAIQFGYDLGSGLDISAILQIDSDENLFGHYSNSAASQTYVLDANDDNSADNDLSNTDANESQGSTSNSAQSSNGSILQIKYAANNIDAIVQIYSGSQEDTDTDANDVIEGSLNNDTIDTDGKLDVSLTQIAVAYSAGMFTPFINMAMGSVEQTPDGGGASTTYDAAVTNIGLNVALASGDSINFSATSSSAESDETGSEDESGSAIEAQYTTNLAGAAVKIGYVSGDYDDGDDATDDDADTALSIRLDYGF